MQAKVVYTLPFRFPDITRIKPSLSVQERGPDGRLGLVIEPVVDYSTHETICSFFEIDIVQGRVSHSLMRLPYVNTVQMQLCYDRLKSLWVVAIVAGTFMIPLDVYELPREADAAWKKVLTADNLEQDYQGEKELVAFWYRGEVFTLALGVFEAAQMYDSSLFWAQWRPSVSEQPSFQPIGPSYTWLPYVCDEGCLFFTCECLYDEQLSDLVYSKMGSGHWQLNVTAYRNDGTFIHRVALPDAIFPLRDLQLARHDFLDWFMLHMSAIDGPRYGHERRQTCVAAVVMHDKPGYLGATKRSQSMMQDKPLKPQGGLYYMDLQGQILQHDPGMAGEQIDMCLCGERVIGTSLQDGRWQLWHWSPRDERGHTVHISLSPKVQQARVVAMETQKDENILRFWCVEEYEHDMRVVLWDGDQLQELQDVWCEGVSVLNYRPAPFVADRKAHGLFSYQETLIIIVLNQEKQIQILALQ